MQEFGKSSGVTLNPREDPYKNDICYHIQLKGLSGEI